jgi:hypothetical protein
MVLIMTAFFSIPCTGQIGREWGAKEELQGITVWRTRGLWGIGIL